MRYGVILWLVWLGVAGLAGELRAHYVGTLGSAAIAMELTRDGERCTGGYTDAATGLPLYDTAGWRVLAGGRAGDGIVYLREGERGNATGSFAGRFSADGQRFAGLWRPARGERTQPFAVREVARFVELTEQGDGYASSLSYPHFTAQRPALAAINSRLKADALAYRQRFTQRYARQRQAGDLLWSLTIRDTVAYASADLVSIHRAIDEAPGLPHPTPRYRAYNYRLQGRTARPIALADLLRPGTDCHALLQPLLTRALRAQRRQRAQIDAAVTLAPAQYAAFTLSPRGITFALEDVGAFAEGPYTVTIPYRQIRQSLRANVLPARWITHTPDPN